MDGYEEQHDHDEDREQGHCSGPDGLIHCIAEDFGGEDDCVSLAEFEAAWSEVGMNGEPQTQFFNLMDIDGNGCISEDEMMQILAILGEKCVEHLY